MMDVGTSHNLVIGNYIGIDVSGLVGLGNRGWGVAIQLSASGNVVKQNVISSNERDGVYFGDAGSNYNTLIGNLIGTDAGGTTPLGNGEEGNGVLLGAALNRVEGNVISGNAGSGIGVGNLYDNKGNFILGNCIGVEASGTSVVGNAWSGVYLGGTRRNFVGGTTSSESNIIGGNREGISAAANSGYNFIGGNYIGTNAEGATGLSNQWAGITLQDHTAHNVIQGNLISGNEGEGVSIGEGSDFNHLRANLVGVTVDGVSPLPNGADGVRIEAASNTVGGMYPEDGNTIAFNSGDGVMVRTYSRNAIRRNSIYSNTGSGISLADGGNNSLPAPLITAVLSTSVSGTACPGCIVEVFSDEEDEGRVYEGYAVADGTGDWTWTGSPSGPYVTATATDEAGNTSPFSAPLMVWRKWIYLPVILREG